MLSSDEIESYDRGKGILTEKVVLGYITTYYTLLNLA